MANPAPRRTGKAIHQPPIDEVAATRERERRAVELAISGASLDQIAQEVGYADKSGAWKAIRRTLDRQEAAAVTELRALENARLDRLQSAWWDKALGGDDKAAQIVLRVFERRAKLNGLDQPQAFVGAFDAGSIPRDPAERVAVLVSLRDRLAERMAENATAEQGS